MSFQSERGCCSLHLWLVRTKYELILILKKHALLDFILYTINFLCHIWIEHCFLINLFTVSLMCVVTASSCKQ